MSNPLIRKKISRGRFLLGKGSAAGTLLFGGATAPREAGARTAVSIYDGFAKNTTGAYVPEGERLYGVRVKG